MSFDQDTRWTIPLTYMTSADLNLTSGVVWFPETEERMKLPGVCLGNDEWIVLNIRQIGELIVHPIFLIYLKESDPAPIVLLKFVRLHGPRVNCPI